MAASALLTIMVNAARKAARSLTRDFGELENLQVSRKGPADFVSNADRRAEEIVFNELRKARPTYGFLMEESGEVKGTDGQHRWIIDPLDGTTNFLHAIPLFAVSIGLQRGPDIVAGVIHNPITDELFTAERGGGAFLNDKRLRVGARTSLADCVGVTGIKRFFVDTLIESGKRGLACQPAIVGVGIGGAKDTCVRLGKEAACLRPVGSRNPDPAAAALEAELTALGNYIGIGAMGFAGTSMVVATHVELAYTHTGGMPVGIHQFCLSSRRATARLHPDGRVEFRSDPGWFTDYYRREAIE